jgi:hypothetical protein
MKQFVQDISSQGPARQAYPQYICAGLRRRIGMLEEISELTGRSLEQVEITVTERGEISGQGGGQRHGDEQNNEFG